jgi:hypothetical protein
MFAVCVEATDEVLIVSFGQLRGLISPMDKYKNALGVQKRLFYSGRLVFIDIVPSFVKLQGKEELVRPLFARQDR